MVTMVNTVRNSVHSNNRFEYGPRHEKTCLQWFANNKGADQPAYVQSDQRLFIRL